jgi:hypothetical protein
MWTPTEGAGSGRQRTDGRRLSLHPQGRGVRGAGGIGAGGNNGTVRKKGRLEERLRHKEGGVARHCEGRRRLAANAWGVETSCGRGGGRVADPRGRACEASVREGEKKEREKGKRKKQRENEKKGEKQKQKRKTEKGIMDISVSYPPNTTRRSCFAKHFFQNSFRFTRESTPREQPPSELPQPQLYTTHRSIQQPRHRWSIGDGARSPRPACGRPPLAGVRRKLQPQPLQGRALPPAVNARHLLLPRLRASPLRVAAPALRPRHPRLRARRQTTARAAERLYHFFFFLGPV